MFVQVNLLIVVDSSHACLNNIVSASNIRPSKTISASNVCLGKPVCTDYVCLSRSICVSKFVKVNQLVIVIFIINLLIQTLFVTLIHHHQLNRYHLYFYFPF